MARRQPAEESLLFDLPLDRTSPAAPEPATAEPIEQPPLPLALEAEDAGAQAAVAEAPGAERPTPNAPASEMPPAGETPVVAQRAGDPTKVTLRLRATAGLTDLGVCTAVALVMVVALLAQGVRPALADWPAGALFLLAFSFLYSVLPLAFWGRTPGMALSGLRAAGGDGRPLTFRQAVLSWLAAVLTVALAGLPLLVALGGRSLGNLISGSRTRRLQRPF